MKNAPYACVAINPYAYLGELPHKTTLVVLLHAHADGRDILFVCAASVEQRNLSVPVELQQATKTVGCAAELRRVRYMKLASDTVASATRISSPSLEKRNSP